MKLYLFSNHCELYYLLFEKVYQNAFQVKPYPKNVTKIVFLE